MKRLLILLLILVLPCAATAGDKDAKQLAQSILTKGAALFDTRDAKAMAATYTEDAEGSVFSKEKVGGAIKVEIIRGRSAFEKGYEDLFKGRNVGTTSRNVVDYARLVGDDLLIIHGRFTLDVSQEFTFPFVQVRTKQGDTWLIKSIHLYLVNE